jgi:prefoldin beta subunit
MEKDTEKNKEEEHECCGGKHCKDHEGHDPEVEKAPVNPANPFGNLDEDTQMKIQELQMLEQNFQQFMQQKNAFSMELNETNYIIDEVKKATGEFSRLVGGQVVISSSKEDILKDMENKKGLIEKRMEEIDKQEKEFSEKMTSLREEVMKKIQG